MGQSFNNYIIIIIMYYVCCWCFLHVTESCYKITFYICISDFDRNRILNQTMTLIVLLAWSPPTTRVRHLSYDDVLEKSKQ
jgi:hypothetical protein